MLLARHAEAVFWMARYIERVENLARILDVQEIFSREAQHGLSWRSVLQLNADETRFDKVNPVANRDAVVRFYLLDAENSTSILAGVRAARANARALRHLISTEMWTHLNMFHNKLLALKAEDLIETRLPRVCLMIKEACQTHTGITEGTFFRDESWYFYNIGRLVERADQTTRLLDIKYHSLLPAGASAGSGLDIEQWNSVLRSAAAYHAYCRIHAGQMNVASVVSFMLRNLGFSRSVALCLAEIDRDLHELRSRHGLRGGNRALERLDHLRVQLASSPIDQMLGQGLHGFLDRLQIGLQALTDDIDQDFFSHETAILQSVQTQWQ